MPSASAVREIFPPFLQASSECNPDRRPGALQKDFAPRKDPPEKPFSLSTTDGRCRTSNRLPGVMITIRSTRFFSSLTLPGQR